MFAGFTIFGKFISSYALCALAGIFIGCPLAVWQCKKYGGNDISMIFVMLFGGIGVFIGMHLLYGITNIAYWKELLNASGFVDFLRRFAIIFGGGVFYGGLIGGLVAGGISMRVQRLDYALYCDCAAPFIAIMHGISRIGCFLTGCCYGVEWKCGITFTDSLIESANGVPRVPVQLFEAGFELLLGGVLWLLLEYSMKTGKLQGVLLGLYLLVYPVGRFILEFFRGDDYRGFIFGLSTSQFISILVLAFAVFYLMRRRFKTKNKAISEKQ